tara:strand:+ start:128 stop:652 length:525 start_codon:yes stop_codon:yes gene_type:complete
MNTQPNTITPLLSSLVPVNLLKEALDLLPTYGKAGTDLGCVNWRDAFQITVQWNNNSCLECYVEFQRSSDRNAILKAAFDRFAPGGTKPMLRDTYTIWERPEYVFHAPELISVNDIVAICIERGVEVTVLYVQESPKARPVFDVMGIPLVPGEMGKEWINGEFHPYSRHKDKCL